MTGFRSSAQTHDDSLPPPLFDDLASATAQPVEPIHSQGEPVHRRGIGGWIQRLGSLNGHISTQSRALAIVVVIGLITGALGGLLLVNAAKTSPQPALVETTSGEAISEITANEAQQLDGLATQLEGAEAQSTTPTISRGRKSKIPPRSNRPRAYRVAIIR